jgi:HPt (histidine-containing phosphotransfer) domain-containing protein
MEFDSPKKREILARLGGDEELLRDIVRVYFEDSPGLIRQIELALDKSDGSAVGRAAHNLKGLLCNFSPEPATAAVQSLEQAARMNELETAADRFAQVQQELNRLDHQLHEWVD